MSTCASSGNECRSDEMTTDGPVGGNRSCDVYVWGSNSSHQLAEGAHEKLTSPKQASAFTDVVEVCRSFVISRRNDSVKLESCKVGLLGNGPL